MAEGTGPAFHVEGRVLGYVLDELESGRDPLGVGETGDPGQDVSDVVSRSLSGVAPDVTRRLAEQMGEHNRTMLAGLDQLSARLIAHRGVDPLVLAWLAVVSADNATADDDINAKVATIDLDVPYDDSGTTNCVTIGDGVEWLSDGIVRMQPVPEALATAVTGGPLRVLVSHPLLDAHPFIIQEIITEDGRSMVTASYEEQWIEIRAVTVDELADMSRTHWGDKTCATT